MKRAFSRITGCVLPLRLDPTFIRSFGATVLLGQSDPVRAGDLAFVLSFPASQTPAHHCISVGDMRIVTHWPATP